MTEPQGIKGAIHKDSRGKQKPAGLTERQPKEGRKSNHQDGGAEGELELGNWRGSRSVGRRSHRQLGQRDEVGGRRAKRGSLRRDRESSVYVLGGNLTRKSELNDVVVRRSRRFSQKNYHPRRASMPMLVLGIRVEHGGGVLLVVVREHDLQMPVRGDEADGMVVAKPSDSSQDDRDRCRVACCENKQQDQGDELTGELHGRDCLLPSDGREQVKLRHGLLNC